MEGFVVMKASIWRQYYSWQMYCNVLQAELILIENKINHLLKYQAQHRR